MGMWGSRFRMIPITATSIALLLCYLHGCGAAEKAPFDPDVDKNPLSNGFGEDIEWVKWEDAIETALEVNKPIFLLIHKTWCQACKALKKTMQQTTARKALKRLSEYFVMVNTADDDEPFEEEYRPDGKYVPRLFFLDKNGDVLSQFKNKRAEYKDYSYYYSSPADILNSMKGVLTYFGVEIPEQKKGEKLKPKKPPPPIKVSEPQGPDEVKPKKPRSDEHDEETTVDRAGKGNEGDTTGSIDEKQATKEEL